MLPSRAEVLAWCLAVVLAAATLGGIGYATRDPDSLLYARIGANLAEQPLSRWIAPEWPPGSYVQGLFRDHPAGLFIPAAFLARLGYPAEQAAYAVGAACLAFSFALVPLVAAGFATSSEARVLSWLLQLLPIFFVFRVRANHEPVVLFFFLLALLGAERTARRLVGGIPLLTAALVGLMLVKGFLVLPALLCCVAWVLVRARADDGSARPRWVLASIVVVGGLAVVAALYEALYRQVTGESFLAGYAQRSFSPGATEGHAWAAATIPYNVLFYSGRIIWFAFPWSLFALAAVVAPLRTRFRGTRRGSWHTATKGLVFVLAAVAIYVGLFSLSGRRAERYIFPVYPLVGGCGAVAALRQWPSLARRASWVRSLEPYAPVVFWLALFGLHIASGRLGFPRLKFWAP